MSKGYATRALTLPFPAQYITMDVHPPVQLLVQLSVQLPVQLPVQLSVHELWQDVQEMISHSFPQVPSRCAMPLPDGLNDSGSNILTCSAPSTPSKSRWHRDNSVRTYNSIANSARVLNSAQSVP